jgi:hypothetical protein
MDDNARVLRAARSCLAFLSRSQWATTAFGTGFNHLFEDGTGIGTRGLRKKGFLNGDSFPAEDGIGTSLCEWRFFNGALESLTLFELITGAGFLTGLIGTIMFGSIDGFFGMTITLLPTLCGFIMVRLDLTLRRCCNELGGVTWLIRLDFGWRPTASAIPLKNSEHTAMNLLAAVQTVFQIPPPPLFNVPGSINFSMDFRALHISVI